MTDMFYRDAAPLLILPLAEEDYRMAVNDALRVISIITVQALLEAASRNEYSIFTSEMFLQTILGSILGVITYHLVMVNTVRAIKL